MKRSFSFLLTFLLLLCLLQTGAFAAQTGKSVKTALVLTFGEQLDAPFSYGDDEASPRCWFRFTPDADGDYQFNFYNPDKQRVFTFNTRLYATAKDAKRNRRYLEAAGDCYDGREYAQIDPHFAVYTLKKDMTYYLDVYLFCNGVTALTVPVTVTAHRHRMKSFYVKPYPEEPGDRPQGCYGKVCRTCGYETDICFFYQPERVEKPTLRRGKEKLRALWQPAADAEGYQLRISPEKSFSKADSKTITLQGADRTQVLLRRLESGKTYYVQVRAFRTVAQRTVYGSWSKTAKAAAK